MIQTGADSQHSAITNTLPGDTELRQLANAMPQLVWIAGPDGRVSFYNDRVAEFAGAHRQENGEWIWEGLVHPEDLDVTSKTWRQALETATNYECEHRLQMLDGSFKWHLSRAFPHKDEQGKVQQWFGTATNIHDQKSSEERFRFLTNSIPQIVWTLDADGNTDYISDQWYAYTNQERTETFDRMTEMMHPEDVEQVITSWKEAFAKKHQFESEYRLWDHLTNTYRWFFARVQPLDEADGTVSKWIGTAMDIQHFRDIAVLLEEQVAERTEELNRLNITLQEQTMELQRSNEDLQQFAHVASHDLKEPLRKISTFTSRISGEYGSKLDGNARLYLDKISHAVGRMGYMIDGILSYSLLGERGHPFQNVDPVNMITEIEKDLELLLLQKNAKIEVGALPVLYGSPVLLQQLFYNLIHNALKFSRIDVPVLIRIDGTKLQGKTIIVVSDNGIGFEPEQSELIFRTFSRLNPKDRYEGTGLGLALCRKIMDRHGGQIQATGTPGAGAEFILTFTDAKE